MDSWGSKHNTMMDDTRMVKRPDKFPTIAPPSYKPLNNPSLAQTSRPAAGRKMCGQNRWHAKHPALPIKTRAARHGRVVQLATIY